MEPSPTGYTFVVVLLFHHIPRGGRLGGDRDLCYSTCTVTFTSALQSSFAMNLFYEATLHGDFYQMVTAYLNGDERWKIKSCSEQSGGAEFSVEL